MSIGCDKSSAFFLENNLVYLSKTKYIDIQYHFVRNMVEQNKVLLEKDYTLKNIIESLTKDLVVSALTLTHVKLGVLPALRSLGSTHARDQLSHLQCVCVIVVNASKIK